MKRDLHVRICGGRRLRCRRLPGEGAGSSGFVRMSNRGVVPGRRRVDRSGPEGKPFVIPKQLVWEAHRRVKADKGGPGGDKPAPEDFESHLGDNIYKIWDPVASGTYFPPPV